MWRMYCLTLPVAVPLHQNPQSTVLPVDPPHLGSNNLQSLFPGDPPVLALATVLRVPLSLRVPVNSYERIPDPGRRIRALLVSQGKGTGQRLKTWLKSLAVPYYLPGIQLLAVIFPVITKRPDTKHFAILNVYKTLPATSQQTT